MIKTAQRRFILITLSILFTVFAVIFGVLWAITGGNFSREIQTTLDGVEREYSSGAGGESALPRIPFRPVMIIEIKSTSGNIENIYGEENFSQDTINAILEKSKSVQSGSVCSYENVYFKVVRLTQKTVVYAADMNEDAARFHSLLVKTLILLAAVFAALAVAVWGLSAKVFEPIKRILAKQKQFISDASHELKTPVSIISANADVIKNQDNASYVDSIKNQVERLNFLVSDLLTLARLDEGNVKTVTESFNLSDEIMQTALPFDAVAFEKGKTLDCDVEPDVFYVGAKDDVKKILNILLDNAVKYASDGGKIKVTLKKAGAKREISVYNDGSLIPEKDSEKIFERFYRGDLSRSRDLGGNGLGLSIAKSIAATNKWLIYANSVYGKSMTVTLVL